MISVVLHVIIVFIAAMLIDVFYVLWFKFSANSWEHRAASMSTLCGGAGLLGAWMVIAENKWYAIPDLAGLYLGTIVGLRFGNWVEKRWEDKAAPKPLTPEEIEKLRKLICD